MNIYKLIHATSDVISNTVYIFHKNEQKVISYARDNFLIIDGGRCFLRPIKFKDLRKIIPLDIVERIDKSKNSYGYYNPKSNILYFDRGKKLEFLLKDMED